ncbi:PIN domain-containing protein [Mycobacterium malmoense]|uniref:PIN domain-containing protein n=1 Tax=Mycobacterium malmoense TaxID=1780 RepID=UPI0008F8327F|nr:PIN domain-containing protein [Mycobacterium malmoense]OIN82815.1 PIN domain-containing protein [Mycobacterium malmoense]
MAFPVVLDACVLAPYPLVDVLLRLADTGIYRPLWSQHILAETRRTMVDKLGVSAQKADKRLNMMRDNFIDAEVAGYEELIGAMRNNEKDRHVLAAAVRERAELIVTADRTGFPSEAVEPYNIEVRHPDDFLLDQLDLYEDATRAALSDILAAWMNPPFTAHQLLAALANQVPNFAAEARRLFPPSEDLEVSLREQIRSFFRRA